MGLTHERIIETIDATLPANRKSAVFADVIKPIIDVERTLITQGADEIARAQAERSRLDRELKEHEASLKEDPSAVVSIAHTKRELLDLVIPEPIRLVVDDATVEALGKRMASQDHPIGVFSAEGGFFDIIAGRYSDEPNLDLVLKAHTGEFARIDRVGRPSLEIARATLSIGLAVQPAVVQELGSRPSMRSRGLLARLLIALPRSTVGARVSSPTPVSGPVTGAYRNTIHSLFGLMPTAPATPAEVPFAPLADSVLRDFMDHIEPDLADGGALHDIADWAGKLTGTIARIATILALARDPKVKVVEMKHVDDALVIGEYLKAHALAAFSLLSGDAVAARAKVLLSWIRRTTSVKFTQRDAFEGTKSTMKTVEVLEGALEFLVDKGYLREIPSARTGRAGRPRGPTFEVNPALNIPPVT